MGRLTSAIPIRPTEEMSYGWTMRKIGIQLPIDDEGRVFVWSVFWPNNQRPQEVRSVLVRSNQDRFWKDNSLFIKKENYRQTTNLAMLLKGLDTPSRADPGTIEKVEQEANYRTHDLEEQTTTPRSVSTANDPPSLRSLRDGLNRIRVRLSGCLVSTPELPGELNDLV